MMLDARRIALLVLGLALMGAHAQVGAQVPAGPDSIQRGHGWMIGTFSIKGYSRPEKPSFSIRSSDGGWEGEVKFGDMYDIPRRWAVVFAFEVPAGTYRFDKVLLPKSTPNSKSTLDVIYRQPIDLEVTVEEGKLSYVGDVFVSFYGGPHAVNPNIKQIRVTDTYHEDLDVFRQRIPGIEQLPVIPNPGTLQARDPPEPSR